MFWGRPPDPPLQGEGMNRGMKRGWRRENGKVRGCEGKEGWEAKS